MLELKTKLLDGQIYVVWFCLTQDSVNDYINKYVEQTASELTDIEDDTLILKDFERVIFPSELTKHNIEYVGPLMFRYLSRVSYNSPLIGVCKFIKNSKDYVVPFPNQLDFYINSLIDEYSKKADSYFNLELLNQGLYYEKASDTVSQYGKIDYELRYLSNGEIIEVIKDQHFDLVFDDDLDPQKIIGAKIGDFIIIDEDQVVIGVLIQNITNRYLYNENEYDEDIINPILKKLNLTSFEELKNSFINEYRKYVARDRYFINLLANMADDVKCDVGDKVIDFLKECNPYPYKKDCTCCLNEAERNDAIKKLLIYYNLCDNELREVDSSEKLEISNSLKIFHLNGNLEDGELSYEINKVQILDRAKEVLKDIYKEYK